MGVGETMERRVPGAWVATIENARAFLPDPMPRAFSFSPEMVRLLAESSAELGGLSALSSSTISSSLHLILLGPLLRREATMSSRIEGTRTDLGQLLLFEATEEVSDPAGDAGEIANYVEALKYGLDRAQDRPISVQFIRELHAILLRDVRGADLQPGAFRSGQNWIGQGGGIERARYVPPPPEHVQSLLDDLVQFIGNPPVEIPPLVRIAMVHYQYEAIHPFLDGNGRSGRLLVVLLLIEWGLLQGPHLTISEFLENRREGYIDGLRGVSLEGDWDGWVRYFLDAIREQARRDRWRVEQLVALRERWRASYQSARSVTLLQMLDFMVERPIFSARQVIEQLGFTHRAVQRAIDQLIVNGVLREITGQRRNRVYAADEVLAIVSPAQGRG